MAHLSKTIIEFGFDEQNRLEHLLSPLHLPTDQEQLTELVKAMRGMADRLQEGAFQGSARKMQAVQRDAE